MPPKKERKLWHTIMYNIILFSNKEEWNPVICRKMDGTGDHVKRTKPH
jgi:hypothetical protein